MRVRAFWGVCLTAALGSCGLMQAQRSQQSVGTVTGQVTREQVIVTDNDVTGQNIELTLRKSVQTDGAGSGGQDHVVGGTGH